MLGGLHEIFGGRLSNRSVDFGVVLLRTYVQMRQISGLPCIK